MKICLVTWAMCLAALVCFAGDDVWLGDYGGTQKVVAARAKISATQSWDGDLSNIPFDFKRASDAAVAYLRQQYPKLDSFTFGSVSLNRISHPEDLSKKWYFQFIFTGIKDNKSYSGHFVWVLSDGTVIEPTLKL